jgi:protein-serine/threonine kinase
LLAGKSYNGKEQDIWALGLLLYTIIYKENAFYSIDEIMNGEPRVPFVMSEGSSDLIRGMLNLDVKARLDIEQVLAHPWCIEDSSSKDRHETSDVIHE